MYIISAPLFCMQNKTKKFIYNLNVYRNAHYRTLSKAKLDYKAQVQSAINILPKMHRVGLTYVLFPKTRRRTDLTNVLSVHDKFFADALVECGKISDDDYKHVIEVNYRFGEVDKLNPRVEIHIQRYNK